jgi:hypothetical protein
MTTSRAEYVVQNACKCIGNHVLFLLLLAFNFLLLCDFPPVVGVGGWPEVGERRMQLVFAGAASCKFGPTGDCDELGFVSFPAWDSGVARD